MHTKEEKTVRSNGWGIDLSYEDAGGKWHQTSEESISAISQAMNATDAPNAPESDDVLVVRNGERRRIPGSGTIALESGGAMAVDGCLPADLPNGYHTLLLNDGKKSCRLIVGPARCWMPEELRTWGWGVQLYAARSRESWGMGDLADLEKLAAWSAQMGAGMLMVNPLSAAIPLPKQQASPYYPSSRRFLNPLWLHIEWIPGCDQVSDLPVLAEEARALNSEQLIQRNHVFRLKMRALEQLWRSFPGDADFTNYCERQGLPLDVYGTYCVLAEEHQTGWRQWPEAFQHPNNQAVARFANEHRHRIDFHKWLQWLIDQQMARCSKHLALMQDLPIGVDPDGADCWAWQEVTAQGATVGAPPDEFNTQGQNWGLPPFIPHKLRETAYEPFIQTVRAAMRNTGGLRVDHVMGLFRLFWIPKNNGGAYVRYNYEDLLTIMALESERAKAYVVGEDLGTVEEIARQQLSAHRVLSYRLIWFEKEHPRDFPKEALAAVTTHDLPTVAGLWSGADLAKQKELGLKPNEKSMSEIHERLATMAGLREGDSVERVIEAAYTLLAQAPSRILLAALDDAAQMVTRPNFPATTLETNWSTALPMPIEELMVAELPLKIATVLRRDS